jgi:geranylgeranyl reductase family protein
MTAVQHFDVLIVGAGPSGCSCALHLASSGLTVAIADRSAFPREKVCGDGLSVKAGVLLDHFPGNLSQVLRSADEVTVSRGARFVTSGSIETQTTPVPPDPGMLYGFVCRRSFFDRILLEEVKKQAAITVFEKFNVKNISFTDRQVTCTGNQGTLTGSLVVGAFGAGSRLYRELTGMGTEDKETGIAWRGYFDDVDGFREDNAIELFFLDELLPGYLWLFPLPGKKANAGIYLPDRRMDERYVNRQEAFSRIIQGHPHLERRFRHARLSGDMQGGILPLGIDRGIASGERFLLTGDAASLIDPFTGEGIANALLSGQIAAGQIQACFRGSDFSSAFMGNYDRTLDTHLSQELTSSLELLKLITSLKYKKKQRYGMDNLLKELSMTYWDVNQKKDLIGRFTPAARHPSLMQALRIPGNWEAFRKLFR